MSVSTAHQHIAEINSTPVFKVTEYKEQDKLLKFMIPKEEPNSNVVEFKPKSSKLHDNAIIPIKTPKSTIELPISPGQPPRKFSGFYLNNRSIKKRSIFVIDSKDNVINGLHSIKERANEIKSNDYSNKEYGDINQITDHNCNSNISDTRGSSISNEELTQSYASERLNAMNKGDYYVKKNSIECQLYKTSKTSPTIDNKKYYSNNGESTKSTNIDRNCMPLTTKVANTRKELTSIRLSLNPKVREINTINCFNPSFIYSSKVNSEIKKRNPSINMIKPKEIEESDFIKKRSKSEQYTRNQNFINQFPTKNIVSYINSKENILPVFEPAKVVIKRCGPIEAFVVNTHKGCVRNYNEDRVSILLNAQNRYMKSHDRSKQKESCSMFSVFDGHGGINCCNYLKENLHDAILDKLDINGLIIPLIKEVYKKVDDDYIKMTTKLKHNYSGSCAITLIVINNSLLVVNTGDSRAVISLKHGTSTIEASSDHKPDKLSEFYRIINNGGELYRMSSNIKTGQNNFYFVKTYAQLKKINELQKIAQNMVFGPWRVKPGGLSVSRTFGDIESKINQKGDINGIVTSEPDISEYDVNDVDFVFLACKLTS